MIQNVITRSVKDDVPKGMNILRVRGKRGTLQHGYVQKLFGVRLLYVDDEEVLIDVPNASLTRPGLKGGVSIVITGMLIAVRLRNSDHCVEVQLDTVNAELIGQAKHPLWTRCKRCRVYACKGSK